MNKETLLLKATNRDIDTAAAILRRGGLVGMPTETVYGLAANALDENAVRDIFRAKGRPQDNPLIVHISRFEELLPLVKQVPDQARALADAFWPGPLTMIFEKTDLVPAVTSGGLDTVAVRLPANLTARRLIKAAGLPLAAPSGNSSGKPSPTRAEHMIQDMSGKIDAIICWGKCAIGVESTVVDVTVTPPRILRPGAITEDMIAAVLGDAATDPAVTRGLAKDEAPRSPGMKYRHYAPKAPLRLFEGAPADSFAALMAAPDKENTGVLAFSEYLEPLRKAGFRAVLDLGESWDHTAHARRLFAQLRRFDSLNCSAILAQCPRTQGAGSGTVNRLRRAAAFDRVECTGRPVLGITGRSGSGKSLLSAQLAEVGCLVLDADAIYKELLPGEALQTALKEAFPAAFGPEGLDKRALAKIVFSDEQQRQTLNAITHGAVCGEILGRMAAAPKDQPVVLDVPLLFECELHRYCTLTAAVVSDIASSAARICKRDGISEEEALRRLQAQHHNDWFRARADLILENFGDLDRFRAAIARLAQKHLGL